MIPEGFTPTYVLWYNAADDQKVPCVAGRYEDIPYGTASDKMFYAEGKPPHPEHGQMQWGLACSKTSRLIVADIDHPEHWEDSATFIELGKLGACASSYREDMQRFHVVIVVPEHLLYLWPTQGPTRWGDVKSNGFSYYTGVHYSGMRYVASAHEWIEADENLLRALQGDRIFPQGTGAGGGSAGDWEDDSYEITGDSQLTADIMSMVVRAGLTDEQVFARLEIILKPLTDPWTHREIQKKIDSAREKHAAEEIFQDGLEQLVLSRMSIEDKVLNFQRANQLRHASAQVQQTVAATQEFKKKTPYEQMAAGGIFPLETWDETAISQAIVNRSHGTVRYASDIDAFIADKGGPWEMVDPASYVYALGDQIPMTETNSTVVPKLPPALQPPVLGEAPSPERRNQYHDEKEAYEQRKAERARMKEEIADLKGQAKEQFLAEQAQKNARLKFRSSAGKNAVVNQWQSACHAYGAAILASDLDKQEDELWTHDRLWDLRTLTERPGEGVPHLRATPWYPDFEGSAPQFEIMMKTVFPDEDTRAWVLKVLGHVVHGKSSDKYGSIVEFRGDSNTGKSMVAKVLMHVLGTGKGYAAPIEDDVFDGTIETARAFGAIPGARLVYLDEWSDRRSKISRTRLKKLTGGLKFQARLLFANAAEYMPHHTFVVSLNSDVTLPYDDEAVRARTVSVPFLNKDRDAVAVACNALDEVLDREAPVILGMLMKHAQMCLADPKYGTMYDAPHGAVHQFAQVVDDTDDIADWLEQRMTIGAGKETDIRDLLEDYNAWAIGAHRPGIRNTRSLGRKLAARLGTDLRRESNSRVLWNVVQRERIFRA